MCLYTYEIAGCRIQFCSDVKLWEDAWSVLFQSTGVCMAMSETYIQNKTLEAGTIEGREFQEEREMEHPIICHITTCKLLPDQNGILLTETPVMRLYREDGVLWQELLALADGRVLARAHYAVTGTDPVHLYLSEIEVPWILRFAHIWAGMDLAYQILWRDRLLLHSASICIGQKVILFLGASGAGKSTQAELWRRYRGAEILNGDKNAIGIRTYGENRCCVQAYGVPFCGTSGICKPYERPLQAVVLIRQGAENLATRLTGRAALTALLENCMGHNRISEARTKQLELAVAILEQIPVFSLTCRVDEASVWVLEQALKDVRQQK